MFQAAETADGSVICRITAQVKPSDAFDCNDSAFPDDSAGNAYCIEPARSFTCSHPMGTEFILFGQCDEG